MNCGGGFDMRMLSPARGPSLNVISTIASPGITTTVASVPYKDRMPIHSDFFLPARRTDLIAVLDLDLDALHHRLWEICDRRDLGRTKRPTVNNYVIAMLIAQGRARRLHGKFYVKDPALWREEAVDLRELPVAPGRVRCQFCGQDYEQPNHEFITCWTCAELIGLRTYFSYDLWDEDRNLV